MAVKKGKPLSVAIAAGAVAAGVALTAVGVGVYENNFERPNHDRVNPSYSSGSSTETGTSFDREEHTLVQEPDIITEGTDFIHDYIEETESYEHTLAPEEEIITDVPEFETSSDSNFDTTEETTEIPIIDNLVPDIDAGTPDIETETASSQAQAPVVDNTKDVTNLLGYLTSWFQQHYKAKYNSSTLPNLTVVGLSSINADTDSDTITINGTLETSGKQRAFTATVINPNPDLALYNITSGEVSISKLTKAISEVATSNNSKTTIKLAPYIKVNNPTAVATTILQSRYNDVSKINSPNAKTEALYIKSILTNVANCVVEASAPIETQYEDGTFIYSFNVSVNTGDYSYYIKNLFEADHQLTPDEIQEEIDAFLEEEVKYSTAYIKSNSYTDNLIYDIQTTANKLNSTSDLQY